MNRPRPPQQDRRARRSPASSISMVLVGLGCSVLYPAMMGTDQPGWVWDHPARNDAMEHMLYAVYITLGLFLIGYARDPEAAVPLINWTIVAGLVHATVMLIHALTTAHGQVHLGLTGDVWATFSVPILLLAGHPRRRTRRAAPWPA